MSLPPPPSHLRDVEEVSAAEASWVGEHILVWDIKGRYTVAADEILQTSTSPFLYLLRRSRLYIR